MKRRFRSVIVLAFLPLLSGCVLFHADFEADTVGAPPSTRPAGPPDDDLIRIWAASAEEFTVIADRLFGNSLKHTPPETVSQIDFQAIETRRTVNEYIALWDGCLDRWNDDLPRYFFSVGSLDMGLANLEIENGEFRAAGEHLADVVYGELHTVRMNVDHRAGTYTVTLAQADPALGREGALCSNSGESRPACPEGFRFERGGCRSGPTWLGYRSHCPLEGRNGCATCSGEEVLDTMNGTCVSRSRVRERVTSSARPLSDSLTTGAGPIKIVMSYANLVPAAPAAYIIDDIWIYEPRD